MLPIHDVLHSVRVVFQLSLHFPLVKEECCQEGQRPPSVIKDYSVSLACKAAVLLIDL